MNSFFQHFFFVLFCCLFFIEMSKRKALSFEEKRTRMKEIFFETVCSHRYKVCVVIFFFFKQVDVYTLKELEKIAPKSKGIIAMSVEEVLTSLVNDDEVLTDKIGTSNYFWVFASHERATVCFSIT